MLVTAITDKIEVVLAADVTTNQLHITASYNATTSSSVTPTKTVTVTNSTTAVILVPGASGGQNQLRYCNIFNADSVPATVTVQINYNGTTNKVISVTLQVNDYMQYTHRTGWKIFDMNGALKTTNFNESVADLTYSDFQLTANTTTNFSPGATGLTYCYYMGRAAGPHKNIYLSYILTSAMVTPTWAEMAVYKGFPSIGATASLTRCGFTDMSTFWLRTTTNMGTAIPVTDVNVGDDIWLVMGTLAVTAPTFRVNTVGDDVGAGFVRTVGTSRPSSNTTLTTTAVVTASSTQMRFGWCGQ